MPPLLTLVEMYPFADIVLRVPSVFVMDSLLHGAAPVPFPSGVGPSPGPSDPARGPEESGELADLTLGQLGLFCARCLGFLAAFVVFILPTRMMLSLYRWLVSLFAIAMAFQTNLIFATSDGSSRDRLTEFGLHFLLLTVFALVFHMTSSGPRSRVARSIAFAAFVVPAFTSLWSAEPVLPSDKIVPGIAAGIGLAYITWGLATKYKDLCSSVCFAVWAWRAMARNHGLHVVLEDEWQRLRVPHVLRLFWLVRFSEHLVFLIAGSDAVAGLTLDDLVGGAKTLLVQGCDTVVAVMGMTSVVSSCAHYLSWAIQQFLAADEDDEKSFGTVSAILFFILALQTGLTGLEPEKRFTRLYRNFCLLSTAILHFVHNMVNPLLMSLSASRNRSRGPHARALAVCGFLLAFPCWFLHYLWSTHHVSTWLLAVSAFSIEVTIKVLISLLIYTLFMIDTYRNVFWERLDDYVYYVRATGNTIEFVFGIFLFFNGAWILLFESGGTIRACMMGIHAYFNIWMQAKAGWKVFMRRRTAVNQISTFQEATAAQLRELNDVCAICYQEMSTARVTRCHHFFHTLCLRKWLYIQDKCPMCHKALYETEVADGNDHGRDHVEPQPEAPRLPLVDDGSQQRNVLRHDHQD